MHMKNTSSINETKEYLKLVSQALRGILPDLFKLYAKLLVLADPKTNEVHGSFSELSATLNYPDMEFYFWLWGLFEFRIVTFNHPKDFSQKVVIKLLTTF